MWSPIILGFSFHFSKQALIVSTPRRAPSIDVKTEGIVKSLCKLWRIISRHWKKQSCFFKLPKQNQAQVHFPDTRTSTSTSIYLHCGALKAAITAGSKHKATLIKCHLLGFYLYTLLIWCCLYWCVLQLLTSLQSLSTLPFGHQTHEKPTLLHGFFASCKCFL